MKIERKHCRTGVYILLTAVMAACGQSEPVEIAPPAPRVSITTLKPVHLDVTEEFIGRVTALRTSEIRPQVSGIVQRQLFEQGTEVRTGQPLFQVNPATFQAEADNAAAVLQRAETALAHARTQIARLQLLVDADAISRQVYDDAVSQRDLAAADVVQARAALARRQLDLKFSTIDAPISGRIDQAFVTEGALVNSGDATPMARIQQIDQVYVDVRRPASSLEDLQESLGKQSADTKDGLPVKLLRSNGTPYDLKGRILFSGVNVNSSTGDVLLRVLVNNPKRQLLPGMFVRALITHQSYESALTIPQQAVVRANSFPQVWVLDKNNRVKLISVELGELVDRYYRIRSGLSAGQKIIVEGSERLSENVQVNALDWQKSDTAPVATPKEAGGRI